MDYRSIFFSVRLCLFSTIHLKTLQNKVTGGNKKANTDDSDLFLSIAEQSGYQGLDQRDMVRMNFKLTYTNSPP